MGVLGTEKRVGILRLRKAARGARRLAALRMTAVVMMGLFWCAFASGSTYYVSSTQGNDSNSGTSSSAAWQTLAKVNSQTLQPGDSVLLRRGDVWNESLIPASSGTAGNPITFDAYGSGAAPNLTGYYAVPATAWVLVSGNSWKAALPSTFTTVNFCLFGSVWGQKVAVGSLSGQWDFYPANGYLYVYSVGSPASYYSGSIVPMALSNVPAINVNGKSWLTFQHILINWFDQFGVYVSGASDHLVIANMEADSLIPQGAQPLGFYVNESAPGPGDIKIYNSEAHMNYDGFRFDGVASAITMINDKGYANRDAALTDNTGAVTYSYCHFYASSLAVAGSTDVLATTGNGAIAGAGNIAADTAPGVQVWQRYPARVTLTVDDAGMTAGTDSYYASTVLPIADAAGAPVGVGITVGYPLAQTLVAEFQSWVNAGRDVTSHSMSHTYYTNTDALDIRYTGSGTSATLSISNKVLTITVAGANDSASYNLGQTSPQGTIAGLETALTATGHFTATENANCQGPYGTGCSYYTKAALLAQDLADVASADVKSAVYAMQLDVTRLTTDEITQSRQWMTKYLTGLPTTPVYVYPGGYETATMQGIAAGVPYAGARGALKEDLGVKDTYASGFDVQNITSFGVNPTWTGLAPAALNQKVQALVWKQMVWGVPWGIFWHLNELSSTEIANLIADLQNSGATILTNTGLVNWLSGGTLETGIDGNFYYKSAAASAITSGGSVDFRPTASSPVVDAGMNLGTAYAIDINGVNQNSYGSGWEIGAHAYIPFSAYGLANSAPGTHFTVGGTATGTAGGPPGYALSRSDTNVCQMNAAAPVMGTGLLGAGTIINGDSCFSNPIVRVTDSNTDPSRKGRTYMGNYGGSGEVSISNNDDTCFMTGESGVSGHIPWKFNPSTMVATRIWTSDFSGSNGVILAIAGSTGYPYSSGVFDHVTGHCVFIGYNANNGHLESVDLSTPTKSTPVFVGDLTTANCAGGVAAFSLGGLSVDDRYISMYGGIGTGYTGQDTWNIALVFDRTLGGCWTLDMTRGIARGDWGQTGPVSGTTDLFGYHQVRPSMDGKYLDLTAGTCYATCGAANKQYFVQVGITTIVPAPNMGVASDHHCQGFADYFNGTTISGGLYQFRKVAYAGVAGGSWTNLNTSYGLITDQHCSVDEMDLNETRPDFNSQEASVPWGGNFTYAWDGEVLGVKNDGSGQVVRFAHTYTDATDCTTSGASFSSQYAIGSVFRSGRFFLFSSCWAGTLGRNDGVNNACTYASSGQNCRGDAFVVKLQ